MAVDITVGDLTGRENEFTLKGNGFCLAKSESKVMKTTDDLKNTSKILEEYYPEMKAFLQELYVSNSPQGRGAKPCCFCFGI